MVAHALLVFGCLVAGIAGAAAWLRLRTPSAPPALPAIDAVTLARAQAILASADEIGLIRMAVDSHTAQLGDIRDELRVLRKLVGREEPTDPGLRTSQHRRIP